jgi:hypothetical protein
MSGGFFPNYKTEMTAKRPNNEGRKGARGNDQIWFGAFLVFYLRKYSV